MKMGAISMSTYKTLILLFPLYLTVSSPSPIQSYQDFLDCLLYESPNSDISQLVYTKSNPSYTSILNTSIQNLRFTTPNTTKPFIILTPTTQQEVQASVVCCKNHSLSIRTRSGGHDYEGLSYRSVSQARFVLVDLAHFREININLDEKTAWVQSGTTAGELYYEISKKSGTLAFPAGTCASVCVGGLFSGGGADTLQRKYGLSIDNILDALLVDVNGRLLNRKSMGEDHFWAIRGGSGGSFGIVVSWKVRLVQVPQIMSVFTLNKSLNQNAIGLMHKWQNIAPRFIEDIHLKVAIQSHMNGREPVAVFKSLFLGRCSGLYNYMQLHFPEMGLTKDDCEEKSWIQSVVYFMGYGNAEPQKVLLDRKMKPMGYTKAKSDFVKDPISYNIWEEIFNKFLDEGAGTIFIETQGGRVSAVSDSDTAFPHREGVLYKMQYIAYWTNGADVDIGIKLCWINDMHKFMTPYASKNPRGAYANFRDLDLGMNEEGDANYEKARVWGEQYFKGNFRRLALIKGKVDPDNFFWHEQSIPPLVITKEVNDDGFYMSN